MTLFGIALVAGIGGDYRNYSGENVSKFCD